MKQRKDERIMCVVQQFINNRLESSKKMRYKMIWVAFLVKKDRFNCYICSMTHSYVKYASKFCMLYSVIKHIYFCTHYLKDGLKSLNASTVHSECFSLYYQNRNYSAISRKFIWIFLGTRNGQVKLSMGWLIYGWVQDTNISSNIM